MQSPQCRAPVPIQFRACAATKETAEVSSPTTSRETLVDEWESDHRNPVNRALHYFVGMPLVGLGLFLLLLLDWRGFAAILTGYAAMFIGHFVFEGNLPTILRTPLGFIGAGQHVIDRLVLRPFRRLTGRK